MRKHVFGRQFKRDINERKSLFRNLATELVLHERIVTTEEKAKAIRRTADKLVTKAKNANQVHAMSLLQPFVNTEAAKKMLDEIAPRFKDRNGGYTRIIRLGRRFNDNAQTVRMEWVELGTSLTPVVEKKQKTVAKEGDASEVVEAEIATEKKTTKKAAPKKVVKKAKGATK